MRAVGIDVDEAAVLRGVFDGVGNIARGDGLLSD